MSPVLADYNGPTNAESDYSPGEVRALVRADRRTILAELDRLIAEQGRGLSDYGMGYLEGLTVMQDIIRARGE